MTTPPTPEQAAAVRRGAAFLIHHGNRDIEGVNAILAELDQDQDLTVRFLMGIATVVETLLPIIFSSTGQWLVQQTCADLAQIECGDRQ